MEKVSITLTEAHHAIAKDAIAAGEYASLSELVREAMRGWEQKRREREAAIESLRSAIAEGISDVEAGRTEPFDLETFLRQAERRWQSAAE